VRKRSATPEGFVRKRSATPEGFERKRDSRSSAFNRLGPPHSTPANNRSVVLTNSERRSAKARLGNRDNELAFTPIAKGKRNREDGEDTPSPKKQDRGY